MKRSMKQYAILTLKGMAMGAADVVPGVSGGTIAFITGIYEELLETINGVNLDTFKKLFSEGIGSAWTAINGNFIVALFLGIGISIVSLAKLITYLLDNHPVLLWSFFFGLVVSSVWLVGKIVKKWSVGNIVGLIAGAVLAYWITILPPLGESAETWFIFLSGMIAICAMILPGISGSFILVLLGSYEIILTQVKEFNITVILTFGAGCLIGLLSFSRALKWMFNKFHDLTVAILTGFLIGSLNKIWPWKETVNSRIVKDKELVLEFRNLLPGEFADLVGEPHTVMAIVVALVGFALIFGLEKLANTSTEQAES